MSIILDKEMKARKGLLPKCGFLFCNGLSQYGDPSGPFYPYFFCFKGEWLDCPHFRAVFKKSYLPAKRSMDRSQWTKIHSYRGQVLSFKRKWASFLIENDLSHDVFIPILNFPVSSFTQKFLHSLPGEWSLFFRDGPSLEISNTTSINSSNEFLLHYWL